MTRLILNGGTLTRKDLATEGQHFCVNRLKSSGKEQELLQEALLRPFHDDEALQQAYGRFVDTSRWAFRNLANNALWSEELILRAYREAIRGKKLLPVEYAWAEYEFRRRVHFAIELLLSALTDALMDVVEGTVEGVVRIWARRGTLADYVTEATEWDKDCMSTKLAILQAALPVDAFLDDPLSALDARGLAIRSRAAYGVAVMLAASAQTAKLRKHGIFPFLRSAAEAALELLASMKDESLAAVLIRLLSEIVVPAHLSTTLRKMSQGQKCSLRFFPEGAILRPTGKPVNAGYSGDRLGNVLGIWADLGVLDRPKNGAPTLSDRGRALVRSLQ